MDKERLVFACSCENTMRLDEAALTKGCGGELRTATQLCRAQLGFDDDRMAHIAGCSIDASGAPADVKRASSEGIAAWLAT